MLRVSYVPRKSFDFMGIPDDLMGMSDDLTGMSDDFTASPDYFFPIPDHFMPSSDGFSGNPDDFLPASEDSTPLSDASVPYSDHSTGSSDGSTASLFRRLPIGTSKRYKRCTKGTQNRSRNMQGRGEFIYRPWRKERKLSSPATGNHFALRVFEFGD